MDRINGMHTNGSTETTYNSNQTEQGRTVSPEVSVYFSLNTKTKTEELALQQRDITQDPFADVPQKKKKQSESQKVRLFVEKLAANTTDSNASITALVSGEQKASTLMRLYKEDQDLALSLVQKRIAMYSDEYKREAATFFGFVTGTPRASQEEQDIYEMEQIIANLQKKHNEKDFAEVLHQLDIFEIFNKKANMQAAFDLAVLKASGVTDNKTEQLPSSITMRDLLNPTNTFTAYPAQTISNDRVETICKLQAAEETQSAELAKLNSEAQAIKAFMNQSKEEQSVWMLTDTMSDVELKAHLTNQKADAKSQCVQALHRFIEASKSVQTVEEQKSMLQAKDFLLKAQIEYLFTAAHEKATHNTEQEDVPFKNEFDTIAQLEAQRPPVALLQVKINWSNAVAGVGKQLLRCGEVPTSQRLRDFYLDYQLKQHCNYNFQNEITALGCDVKNQVSSAANAVVGKVKQAVSLVSETVKGNYTLSKSLQESLALSKGTSSDLLDNVRGYLNDYAVLCQQNPQMARMLAGNLAQTLAVIKNSVGTSTELYNIFNELNSRINAEAMACYMIGEFSPEASDITKLSKENLDSLKKMYALCQFFQWAPEAVVATTGAVDIALNAGSGSVLGTGVAVAKTAFRMVTTHAVKRSVSTLSNDEVKLANAALLTVQHGPEEAARRIQAMQATAEIVVDQARGTSVKRSILKTIFRPLNVRFTRLQKAFQEWKKTDNIMPLLSETLKITAVVGPTVVSVMSTPVIALTIGPAFIGYAAGAGLLASCTAMNFFYKTDVAEDALKVIKNRVTDLIQPNVNSMLKAAKQLAKEHLKLGAYKELKSRTAYVTLYNQYKDEFAKAHSQLFNNMTTEIENDFANNSTYQQQVVKMQQFAEEAKKLEAVLEAQPTYKKIVTCVDEQTKKQVPTNTDEAIYWAMGRLQFLQENLLIATGSEFIPEDKKAVADMMLTFNVQVAMGQHMSQTRHYIARAHTLIAKNVEDKINNMIEKRYEAASLRVLRITASRTVNKITPKNGMTTEALDKLNENGKVFRANVKAQIRTMQRMLTPMSA